MKRVKEELKEKPEEGSTEESSDESTEEVSAGEKVEVDVAKLDAILKRLDEKDQEIKVLRDAIGTSKLGLAEDKNKAKVQPRAFLKVYRDDNDVEHLITSWKSSSANKIIYNPTTNLPVGEILLATYYFLDGGDTGEIGQSIVTKIDNLAYGTIIEDKGNSFILQMDNAKWGIVEVNKTFVNP